MAAAIALEVLSNTPVANRPTLSGSTTSRARKIASGAQLSDLDKSRIKAFFSTHTDENSLEFGLNGGLAMKSFLESDDIADSSLSESTMSENSRYKGIDFTPPKGVKEAAKRALEVRAEKPTSQRGMTDVGIARARDLSNGKNLSPETVRRMLAYFERHEVDKKGESWDEQGKGWQAWHGWGGDAGFSWARKIVNQMDNIDDKE
jgi:DNA-directed RNA polymerase subunit K/omega